MTEQNNARIKGKIYFKGDLVFKDSFVTVSSGIGNEATDSMVYRDSDGCLIIPAASFAGVLREKLENMFEGEKKDIDSLFGNNNSDEEKKCSDIVFTDLYAGEEVAPVVQQGVKISRKYLAAEDKGKFDREVALNKQFPFYFYIEKTRNDKAFYERWVNRLAAVFNNKNIFFVGGRNSVGNGWGRFENVKCLDYDFSDKAKMKRFLKRSQNEEDFVKALMEDGDHSLSGSEIESLEDDFIQLEYTIKFKDAFLINDPDAEPDDDEAEFNFLKIGDNYTMPGSSIKGVFRSRSEIIAKTVGIADQKIKEVFGHTDEKSNIYFSYAFLEDKKVNKKLMNGVSIDRFTGGAAEAALFDFKLLMNGTFKGRTIIYLSDETLWFPGLLYLVIRDIRDGDLSFGFGRTKGWGRAESFEFKIKGKNLPDKWEKYVKGEDFNLDELENLYKSILPPGEKK